MEFRSPSHEEHRLLSVLGHAALKDGVASWLSNLKVRSLEDGGMGSLELAHSDVGQDSGNIKRLAALQFVDVDGVVVVVSLNADSRGVPIELDVWKSDFSRVQAVPPSLVVTEIGGVMLTRQ